MEASPVRLNNRVLWPDGDSSFSEDQLTKQLSVAGPTAGMFIDEMTSQIEQYNQYVRPEHKISVKAGVRPNDYTWNLPEEYAKLDVYGYIARQLVEQHPDQQRIARVGDELDLYERMGLTDVLRTLIYIINTLQAHKVVWGVGRGSSVASYVLFLIGVHNVDSVKYQLDIEDFLRPDDRGE